MANSVRVSREDHVLGHNKYLLKEGGLVIKSAR